MAVTSAAGGGATKATTVKARSSRTGDTSAAGGSTWRLGYGDREVKVYPVNETEMETLSHLGADATLLFSIASGLLGFGINTIISLTLAGGVSPFVSGVYWSAIVLCLLGSVACFIYAGTKWKQRNNTLTRVKSETVFLARRPN
jgi:hypothetical protein